MKLIKKNKSVTDQQTDQPTDGRTDKAGRRVACMRLKKKTQSDVIPVSNLKNNLVLSVSQPIWFFPLVNLTVNLRQSVETYQF